MYWICREERRQRRVQDCTASLLECCPGHSCCSEPLTLHLLFHILPSAAACSEPISLHPISSSNLPYLWLLEELAALFILNVGDLTVLYLRMRAVVRLGWG